ncbi:MAG: hypothetical protein HY714_05740 [Candidatus Omnitrophica bacterium]|nr:hypothetical protein [Candidatus Omnitrophota bacterium]
MRFRMVFTAIFLLTAGAGGAQAEPLMLDEMRQDLTELQRTVKMLQSAMDAQSQVIREQAQKIQALESREIRLPGALGTAPASAEAQTAGLSQGINPDIGVVGTVMAHLTEDGSDGEGRDTIALKEMELNFSQYVDPYSRLDAVISVNDEIEAQNLEIEEGYYTHWGLPLGFRGQIGKFRSKIGKQNLLHLDQLPTSDYPLVVRDFFGEEGLSSSGARLQNFIPNPWDFPLELTGEVLRGNNGASFSGISRRPIFNTHLKTFHEFSKESNMELGWTTLFGDDNPPVPDVDGDGVEISATRAEGQDRYRPKVFGADLTYNRLLAEGKTFKWQNEAYFQNRESASHVNQNPWGFYSLVDYRFSRRFSAGIRFDYLEPLDVVDQHGRTTAISPYFTFWQSEFAHFRIQYSHTDPASAEAEADDAIFLQANILIGSHKHPVQ